MAARTVDLRRIDGDGDFLRRWVPLDDDGDLRVEGQDLGRTVEEIWGDGLREYEFIRTVRKEHVPLLIDALGGQPGDDVLDLIEQRFAGQGTNELEKLIQEHDVPNEFWSRVGD